jgi:transposase
VSSPYGAVTGLVNWGKRLQKLPQQALDTVARVGEPIQHGVEYVENALGIPLGQSPQPNTQWHDQAVQDANQSFQPRRMMPKGK